MLELVEVIAELKRHLLPLLLSLYLHEKTLIDVFFPIKLLLMFVLLMYLTTSYFCLLHLGVMIKGLHFSFLIIDAAQEKQQEEKAVESTLENKEWEP